MTLRPLSVASWALVLVSALAVMLSPSALRAVGIVPLMMILLQVLLEALRAHLPEHPDSFNFPDKEDFLRLPDEFRAPVIRQMQWMLDATALVMQVALIVVLGSLWLKANGRGSPAVTLLPILLGVFTTPGIFLLLSRVTNALEEQMKEWRAAGSPPRATR